MTRNALAELIIDLFIAVIFVGALMVLGEATG